MKKEGDELSKKLEKEELLQKIDMAKLKRETKLLQLSYRRLDVLRKTCRCRSRTGQAPKRGN